MTTENSTPLAEAIFELRWGEIAPQQFSYTQDEQQLFAGKVSVSASSHDYRFIENIPQKNLAAHILPLTPKHRFRKEKDSWPCYQLGLGIFTINQVKEGYSWSEFKKSIKTGLNIYRAADSNKLDTVRETLSLVLRYQNVFNIQQTISAQSLFKQYLKLQLNLPDELFEQDALDEQKNAVYFKIDIEAKKLPATVSIVIGNVNINTKPGFAMETIIISKAKDYITEASNNIDIDETIMKWSESAHSLQKHIFKTLIKH